MKYARPEDTLLEDHRKQKQAEIDAFVDENKPVIPKRATELMDKIRIVTKLDQIARVCHEVNRAYCQSLNDNSQVPWEEAEEWQKESARKGVQFKLDNPGATAKDQHRAWMMDKLAEGWQWGSEKDASKKLHPCLLPYSSLSLAQRTKDVLFQSVVEAMR